MNTKRAFRLNLDDAVSAVSESPTHDWQPTRQVVFGPDRPTGAPGTDDPLDFHPEVKADPVVHMVDHPLR